MNRKNAPIATSRWIFGCLLALLFAMPAAAAPEQVAEIENTGSKLVVYPTGDGYSHVTFTVTGPCNYQHREIIEPGGYGLFQVDETTIDAIYRLELVRVPKVTGSVLEVLQQARKTNDNSEVDKLCREGELPGDPLTQTLGFRILDGRIMWDPFKQEDSGRAADAPIGDGGGLGIPLKDFVINDDLIVDGSACIGFDCVNGESFGFDTIRLKENNLRIKFDDTSVAASFPRTDWQLTANASANGGASKFSIDDISGSRTPFTVEANARSHSLYVDDGGRIGSRTSTPSTEIHTIDGDTPTLRLQQDGSSGFAPQTWDVAGNETNFFIRDVTNGSTLPFRIRPGAPTSSIFIDVDGDVGLGTASPDSELHLNDTDGVNFRITGTSSGILQGETDSSGNFAQQNINNDVFRIRGLDSGLAETAVGIALDTNSGGIVGVGCTNANDAGSGGQFIVGDGGTCESGSWSAIVAGSGITNSSSRSLKENLQEVGAGDILDKITAIDVYTYDFISGPKDAIGLMAEDFHQIFGRGSEKMINDREVQMALWLAVQQLTAQNQQLVDKLSNLEAQLQTQSVQ